MSFRRDDQSKSKHTQTWWSSAQFTPDSYSDTEYQRLPTQEDKENQAFEQDQFEATGLQLKEKNGTITPVEQERLALLQARMASFWSQRMERAKAQPNLLEIFTQHDQGDSPLPATTIAPPPFVITQPDQFPSTLSQPQTTLDELNDLHEQAPGPAGPGQTEETTALAQSYSNEETFGPAALTLSDQQQMDTLHPWYGNDQVQAGNTLAAEGEVDSSHSNQPLSVVQPQEQPGQTEDTYANPALQQPLVTPEQQSEQVTSSAIADSAAAGLSLPDMGGSSDVGTLIAASETAGLSRDITSDPSKQGAVSSVINTNIQSNVGPIAASTPQHGISPLGLPQGLGEVTPQHIFNTDGSAGADLTNALNVGLSGDSIDTSAELGVGVDELSPILDEVFNQFINASNVEFDQKIASIDSLAQEALVHIETSAQTMMAEINDSFTEGRTTVSEAFGQSRQEVEQAGTSAKQELTQAVSGAQQQVDEKRQIADTNVDTSIEQATSRLQDQVAAVQSSANVGDSQAQVQSHAQVVKSRYAGKDAQAEVHSAVDEIASRSTSELQTQTNIATTELGGVVTQAQQRWQTEGHTAHQHIETAVQSAKTAIDQGKSQAEQGIDTKVQEQLASFDTAETETLSQLDTQEAEQVAAAEATVDTARQGLAQSQESQHQDLEQARLQTQTSAEHAQGELAAMLQETPDMLVDPVTFRAGLEQATGAQLQSVQTALDGSALQLQSAWQQEADTFAGQAQVVGTDAQAGIQQGTNTTKTTLTAQVTQIQGALDTVAIDSGQKIADVGQQSAQAMDQTAQQMQGGLEQGLSNVSSELTQSQHNLQTNKASAVHQTSGAMQQAAQEADRSWWEKALSAIGSFLSGLWDGIARVFTAIGDALLWVGKQLVNVVWGFVWGEPVFTDIWGAEFFTFLGDLIAGILVWGDIRDIVKYWIIYPLQGKGPWWLNVLLGGVAILGIIPIIGDGFKAVVKQLLKRFLKTAVRELTEKLGKELAERLVKELGEEAAQKLVEDLGAELVQKLAQELSAQAIQELAEKLGKETLEKLAAEVGGKAIQQLVAEGGERLLKELEPATLKQLLNVLSPREIKELHDKFDSNTLRKLVANFANDEMWESPAGLRYGSDPNFDNRVQHIFRHGVDEPLRPGAHGVFTAGRSGALEVIDEAWTLAQRGGPHVEVSQQGARTRYIVDMGREIGYVGGQKGAAEGYPAARHVLLVVENGNRVVTAFPVIP